MDRLVALASPLANRTDVQLVLIRDPVHDPSELTAFQSLQRAFDQRFPPQAELDVLVSDRGQPPSELAKSCDALLTLGSEAPELIQAVGLPQLESPVQILEMLKREGRGERTKLTPVASTVAAHPDSSPVISVIVAAHERPAQLSQLLSALDGQDLSADKFEVIISDDGSEAPLADTVDLSKHSYAIVLLRQEQTGPAAARNAAIRHARGALLVFLDDDAVPSESCLSGHLAAQLNASGNTAVMGSFSLAEAHRNTSLSQLLETSPMAFPHPALKPGKLHRTECLRAVNMSIPTALIEAIGGFDETFNIPSAEDSEMAKRLGRALATPVLYDPEIGCSHDDMPSIDKFAQRQQRLGWSTSYMAWRHDDHTLIVGPNSSPPGEQFWEDLEARLEKSIPRIETVLAEIRTLAEQESSAPPPSELASDFAEKVREIGFAFFSRGLIDGHREIQVMIAERESPQE
jgi:GT2 family glycosyltransferase